MPLYLTREGSHTEEWSHTVDGSSTIVGADQFRPANTSNLRDCPQIPRTIKRVLAIGRCRHPNYVPSRHVIVPHRGKPTRRAEDVIKSPVFLDDTRAILVGKLVRLSHKFSISMDESSVSIEESSLMYKLAWLTNPTVAETTVCVLADCFFRSNVTLSVTATYVAAGTIARSSVSRASGKVVLPSTAVTVTVWRPSGIVDKSNIMDVELVTVVGSRFPSIAM